MAKFKDKYKPEQSPSVCKRNRFEGWQDRHRRRQLTAERHKQTLGDWCDKNNLRLHVSNNQMHWTIFEIDANPRPVAQWWPRTAKFVIRKQYRHGVHVHDVGQVINELDRLLLGRERAEHRKWGA